MSKRAHITRLVILLLVVIIATQCITVWLGSGNAIPVQVADWSTFGNDLSSFSLARVYLMGGCSVGSAGGCPN